MVQYVFGSRAYGICMTFWGFFIACVWAPMWIKSWRRTNAELNVLWDTSDVLEVDYKNPSFDPTRKGLCGKVSLEERSDPEWKQSWVDLLPVKLVMTLFMAFMIPFQFVITAFCVHAYMVLKTLPSCDMVAMDSNTWCVTGFFRWLLILLLGMMFGLFVDIIGLMLLKRAARTFTEWENHRYEEDYEKNWVFKVFCYDGCSMYFWYFSICFLYVPFGEWWTKFVSSAFGNLFYYDVRQDHFDLKDAFLTPLVVTAALNFLLETFVPYVINIVIYNMKYKKVKRRGGVPALRQMAESLASDLSGHCMQATGSQRPVVAAPYAGEGQQTFQHIMFQQDLTTYSSITDYNDMIMQFGYVCFFSVVWPWIPVCAWVNNLFEIRGDAFNLFFSYRRPFPRKTKGIGQWEKCAEFIVIISLAINVGLVCISTGHLEWFFPSCHKNYDGRFGPDASCIDFFQRFAYMVLMEHVGLFLSIVVFKCSANVPKWVRRKQRADKQRWLEKENVQTHATQTLSSHALR